MVKLQGPGSPERVLSPVLPSALYEHVYVISCIKKPRSQNGFCLMGQGNPLFTAVRVDSFMRNIHWSWAADNARHVLADSTWTQSLDT